MVKICDQYCDGCIYRGLIHGKDRWCKYQAVEGHRRPCPAGTGCTAKMTPAMLAARKRAEKIGKVMLTVVCQICGAEFQTTDRRRKNCSPECLAESRKRSTERFRKRKMAEKKQKLGGDKHA